MTHGIGTADRSLSEAEIFKILEDSTPAAALYRQEGPGPHPGHHPHLPSPADDPRPRGADGSSGCSPRLHGCPWHPYPTPRGTYTCPLRYLGPGKKGILGGQPLFQPPLGSAGHPRPDRLDREGGNRGTVRRPPQRAGAGGHQPGDLRLRPDPHPRSGLSARGGGLLGRRQIPLPRHLRRRVPARLPLAGGGGHLSGDHRHQTYAGARGHQPGHAL